MERECLGFLLRGIVPVILCPAKGLASPRLAPAEQSALDDGRLLLLSPFAEKTRRTNAA